MDLKISVKLKCFPINHPLTHSLNNFKHAVALANDSDLFH